MARSVGNHYLHSMIIILLLMKGSCSDMQPDEKAVQETKELCKSELAAYPQLSNVGLPLIPIFKSKNQKCCEHLAAMRVQAPADFARLSNDYVKREAASWNSHANNIRPFQQLGHYSRSLTRQMQQQQERKGRIPLPLLPSPAPLLYSNLRVAPLTSMAQSAASDEEDDLKRTVFLSNGWAPSGHDEAWSGSKTGNQEHAEKKMTSSSYAFTSNHWGPMGKRQNDIRTKSLRYTKRLMGLGLAHSKHESKNMLSNPNFVDIPVTYDMVQPIVKVSPEIGNKYAAIPSLIFLKPLIVNIGEFKRKGKVKK